MTIFLALAALLFTAPARASAPKILPPCEAPLRVTRAGDALSSRVIDTIVAHVFTANRELIPEGYRFNRAWTLDTVKDVRDERRTLSAGQILIRAELYSDTKAPRFHFVDLLWNDGAVVPLGTHHLKQPSLIKVLTFNAKGELLAVDSIVSYVRRVFGATVTMYRALSAAELSLWQSGGALGSSSWHSKGFVHFTVDKVTSEFRPSGAYAHAIGVIIDSAELVQMIAQGQADLSTYSFFLDGARHPELGFDYEVRFRAEPSQLNILINGYRRWVEREQTPAQDYLGSGA